MLRAASDSAGDCDVTFRATTDVPTTTAERALEPAALPKSVATTELLHIVALLVITLIGVLVRLYYLTQPLKYDEAVTFLEYVRLPLSVSLSQNYLPNNHLFHTLLARVSVRLFGEAEWSLRMPAFVAGVLMIPMAYVALRRLFSRDAALLAAALVAGSSILVDYSTNARGYTMVGFAFLLLLACAETLRRSGGAGWGTWALFAVTTACGFYTIPVMLYPFGAVALWLAAAALLQAPAARNRILVRLTVAAVVAGVLTLLLYTPVLLASGPDAIFDNQFVQRISKGKLMVRLPLALAVAVNGWRRDLATPVAVTLLAGVLASLTWYAWDAVRAHSSRHHLPSQARPGVDPLVVAVLWCFAAVLLHRVVPPPRTWQFLLPLLFAAAGFGCLETVRRPASKLMASGLPHPIVGAALVSALAVAMGADLASRTYAGQSPMYSDETGTLPEAARIAHDIAAKVRMSHRIVADVPADAPLQYYLRRAGVSELLWTRRDPNCPIVWVVTYDDSQHLFAQLEQAMKRARLRPAWYGGPRVIRKYPRATLTRYVRRRVPATMMSGPELPAKQT